MEEVLWTAQHCGGEFFYTVVVLDYYAQLMSCSSAAWCTILYNIAWYCCAQLRMACCFKNHLCHAQHSCSWLLAASALQGRKLLHIISCAHGCYVAAVSASLPQGILHKHRCHQPDSKHRHLQGHRAQSVLNHLPCCWPSSSQDSEHRGLQDHSRPVPAHFHLGSHCATVLAS